MEGESCLWTVSAGLMAMGHPALRAGADLTKKKNQILFTIIFKPGAAVIQDCVGGWPW